MVVRGGARRHRFVRSPSGRVCTSTTCRRQTRGDGMTRKGTAKSVDASFTDGRLRIARAFLKAARTETAMAEVADIGNPIISQIVNAAIAFADALTARYAGRANQKDHAAAVKALRDALGNRLPVAQET